MSNTAFAKQTTKECIKEKFLDIYSVTPLAQISVSELAKECHISRSTFYFYFEDVRTLYRACEQDVIDRMESNLSDVILCTVTSDFKKFVETYSNHLKGYIKYIDVYKCLLNGSEEASFRKAWFESIRRHYEKSMNFSRTASPSQRDNLTRYYAGGQLSILSNWVLTDCREAAEDIAHISAQVLFQGTFLAKQI